jgi:hypothetical protein
MNKVYVVFEDYDSGRESNTTIFSTEQKAIEYFNYLVDREKSSSWIRDNYDYIETDTAHNFYAYDDVNGDSTSIFMREKEIL